MKRFFENFAFLSPYLTIKTGHLSKRDVKNIKISLANKMGAACLIIAALLLLVTTALFISMGLETGWKTAEVYGITSFVSQILTITGCSISIVCEIVSLKVSNKTAKIFLVRLASNLLFIIAASQLFLSFYADASMGYISTSPTLSPSIVVISLLIIIQPVFWSEAITYDAIVSALLIGLSIYFSNQYGIQGVIYYIFVALLYPFVCYLVISILFYAETQRYREALRNEILNNKAMYDELTHCKNRYALNTYLEESKKRWATKEANLLIVMFDIDDFKQYNDQYSHLTGDYCLVTIANTIRKEYPSPDLDFYRFGGEEFLLFFEISDKSEAKQILENIRICVRNLGIEAAKEAKHDVVTVSAGGLFIKAGANFNYEENLALVDKYLYKAKDSGKDVCILNDRLI